VRRFALTAGVLLATAGTALAVLGIWSPQSSGKELGTGLVLLFGAGVFAILSLGGRRNSVPEVGRADDGTVWHHENLK
jgi:hypothetical protein